MKTIVAATFLAVAPSAALPADLAGDMSCSIFTMHVMNTVNTTLSQTERLKSTLEANNVYSYTEGYLQAEYDRKNDSDKPFSPAQLKKVAPALIDACLANLGKSVREVIQEGKVSID